MTVIKRFRPGEDDVDRAEPVLLTTRRMNAAPLNVLFFARLCESKGLPRPVAEYVFHPTRKWRLDVAWPAQKVGLEVHGGSFYAGRHNRPMGNIGDQEKLNEAQILGWVVLQVPRSVGGKDSWLSLDTVDLCARALARQKVRNG